MKYSRRKASKTILENIFKIKKNERIQLLHKFQYTLNIFILRRCHLIRYLYFMVFLFIWDAILDFYIVQINRTP